MVHVQLVGQSRDGHGRDFGESGRATLEVLAKGRRKEEGVDGRLRRVEVGDVRERGSVEVVVELKVEQIACQRANERSGRRKLHLVWAGTDWLSDHGSSRVVGVQLSVYGMLGRGMARAGCRRVEGGGAL